jgi:hypothetical protein
MKWLKAPLVVGCLVAVALLPPHAVHAQANPRLGTWKLNLAKSKYELGPAPRSETRTYVAAGDSVKLTAETVAADGTKQVTSYTAKYDGKDYPYTGLTGDTISIKPLSEYSNDATVKKSGKVVQTTHSVVSRDGKTMTLTTMSANGSAKPAGNVRVYDKQ